MTGSRRRTPPGLTVAWGRVRRVERRARARLWDLAGWAEVGAGAQVGRRCRRSVEPGGRLVIGDGVEVDDGVTLAVSATGRLEIGRRSFVGHHTTLAARDSLRIGARTFLAELVSVRDHDHDPAQVPSSGAMRSAPVVVGDDVWLAAKVTVLRGTTIGTRSIVAANSVVTRDVEPGEVVGGIPARHLRWVEGFERSDS